MQKTISFILTIAFIVHFNVLFSQNFEKNNWYVDVGIGVGNYNGKTETLTVMPNSLSIDGTPEYISSLLIPLQLEYAVSNKVGLGLDVDFNNYFIAKENKSLISSMRSFDYGIHITFLFLSIGENDLFAGINYGFSTFKWDFKEPNSLFLESRQAKGLYTCYSINNRFYFSEKVSILFQLGISVRNYTKITESHYETPPPVSSNYFSISVTDFDTFGTNYGIGLSIKL